MNCKVCGKLVPWDYQLSQFGLCGGMVCNSKPIENQSVLERIASTLERIEIRINANTRPPRPDYPVQEYPK